MTETQRERGEVLVAVNQETECRTFPGLKLKSRELKGTTSGIYKNQTDLHKIINQHCRKNYGYN